LAGRPYKLSRQLIGNETSDNLFGDTSMDTHLDKEILKQRTPDEWRQLICKLRWVGLDIEAEHVQAMLNNEPSNDRERAVAKPHLVD
jgi:hypothetical protein